MCNAHKVGNKRQGLEMTKKSCQRPLTAVSEQTIWSSVGSSEGLDLKRCFWRYAHKHYVFRKERMALIVFKNISKKDFS